MAKLTRLFLQNYRNIAELELVLGGKDGKIVGQNRIGKTNCIEAICYLLTDKLLGGSADIASIKNQRDTRLKVVVEGTFLTQEGEVTLRKEYYEKWVRPRGSATEEMQGHSTDYFINGAKQSRARDFYDLLEQKLGIPTTLGKLDAIQLVIDPFYLAETVCGGKDWKFAREAVIDIVGDVLPNEIYAANEATKYAKEDLERHQYNDGEAKKAIRGEIDGYKKKVESNDAIINEYSKAVDVPEDEYQAAKARGDEIATQIKNLENGDENPYAEEVTKLQNELFGLQQKQNATLYAPVDHTESEKIWNELQNRERELLKLQNADAANKALVNRLAQELQFKQSAQNTYKKRLVELGEQAKAIMVDDTCPTCGQKLPPEKMEEAYNKKKAQILAEAQDIRDSALKNKQAIQILEEQMANANGPDLEPEITVRKVNISQLRDDLEKVKAKEYANVPKPDPVVQERIKAINERLAQIQNFRAESAKGNEDQIKALCVEKDEVQAKLSKRIAFESAKKRMAEIKAENAKIAKLQADAEQRIWAVGEFTKTKLQLLDKHMEEKLGEVRFQLIKENIKSGSYDEVCTPYIINPAMGKRTNTLFPDGSKSEQIYTGIQIIKAIRNVKGWEPLPVLFDQGGELDNHSMTKVAYDAEAQIIAVKVEGPSTIPMFVPFSN